MSLDETLDIGEDTGTLEEVTINIAEQKLTEKELQQYREGLLKSALAE